MKKKLKELTLKISQCKNVKAMYLFGSHSTGKAGHLSDIDICVVAPHATEKQKNDIRSHASDKMDIVLFEDLPIPIRIRVFQEGRPLYTSDKKYISQLAWRTTKEYWDFKPILKEFIEQYLPGVNYV